jgi:hypothetical protein
VKEIELRCRAHNQYQAVLDDGAELMARCRGSSTTAREPCGVERREGSMRRDELVPGLRKSTAPMRSVFGAAGGAPI